LKLLGEKKLYVKNAVPMFIGKNVGTVKMDTTTTIAEKTLVVVLNLGLM